MPREGYADDIGREDLDECWCCGGLHDSLGALCPNCDDAGCTHFGGECQSDHKPALHDGGQAMSDADLTIHAGQTWTMDESRADPEDVPAPHDVDLWAAQPSFHAVVDDILDGLVELTVTTGNDHPRTPDFGTTVDVAADRLRDDPRWEVRR